VLLAKILDREHSTKEQIEGLHVFPVKGTNASRYEKNLVLVRAWDAYKRHGEVTETDVNILPDYGIFFNDDGSVADHSGLREEAEYVTLGGIDLGEHGKPPGAKKKDVDNISTGDEDEEVDLEIADSEESDAEVRERIERERRRKEAKQTKTGRSLIEKYRNANPGKVLLWKANGYYLAWDKDAELLSKIFGGEAGTHPSGLSQVNFPTAKLDDVLAKLFAGKHKPALVYDGDDGEKIVKDAIPPKPAAGPPTTVKADTNKKVVPNKPAAKPGGNGKKYKPGNARA